MRRQTSAAPAPRGSAAAGGGEQGRSQSASQPLESAERLLHVLIDSSQAAVYAKDAEGRYTLANPRAERLLGAPPGELTGKTDADLMPARDAEVVRGHDREVMETGQPREYEEEIIARGETRTFVAVKVPLVGDDGDTVGVGTVATDITPWKVAENDASEAAETLGLLARITTRAIGTLDLDAMLLGLLPEIADALDADVAVVLLREGKRLVVRASYGLDTEEAKGFSLDIGVGFGGTVAATREPLFISDLRHTAVPVVPAVRQRGICSMLGVPLMRWGELIGVLHVDWDEPQEFDPDRQRLLGLIADRIALAVSNARLYEEQRNATQLAETLNAVNELLLTTVDLDEMLSALVSRVAFALEADRALIIRPDGDEWVVLQVHNLPDALLGRRYSRADAPALEETKRSRTPLFVEDALNHPIANSRIAEELGLGSYTLLPLIVQDEVVGILNIAFIHPRGFSDWHRSVAQRLATSVSLALESARLYETEHRVASTLQESLLAMPESIAGVTFACTYSSATQAARVGGDFFDLFEIEGGRVGVLIGDVSGKGLDAAVLTSLVKNSVRAYAADGRHGPATVVGRTNKLVERATPSEIFVTVFFGVLSRARDEMTYCNAGHTTGMLRRAQGPVERLAPTSPLVGAFAEFTFAEKTVALAADDLVVLYTDGLLEARDDGHEQFGEDRVADVLSAAGGPPASAIEQLSAAVAEFTGGKLSDDVAILALRRDTRDAARGA